MEIHHLISRVFFEGSSIRGLVANLPYEKVIGDLVLLIDGSVI